jgi:hypothetical protein
MQHLPSGIQPQTAQQPAGVCHVCYVEDYSDDNLLLQVILVILIRQNGFGLCPVQQAKPQHNLLPDSSHMVFNKLVLVRMIRSRPCCQNQLSSAAAYHKVHALLLVCQSVQQCSRRHLKYGCLACLADVKISLLRQ